MKILSSVLITLLFIPVFSQEKIDAYDLLKDIKAGKSIKINNAVIKGTLDLTFMDEAKEKLPKAKRWFMGNKSNTVEKQIKGKIIFINCTFQDDVLAYIPDEKIAYTFIANFEDDVVFKNCIFEERAMFKYSEFEENADFSNTKFIDDSTFKYANFEGNANFENTAFRKKATFKYTEFDRFANFKESTFKDFADFKYARFSRGLSFNSTTFKDDLNIKYAKISGDFDIKNMEARHKIDAKYTKINGKSFRKYKYLLKEREDD